MEYFPDIEDVDLEGDNFSRDVQQKKEIQCDTNNDKFSDLIFDHFMPGIIGPARLINEYHSDRKSPYCMTFLHDEIKFHQLYAEDPDHFVKVLLNYDCGCC